MRKTPDVLCDWRNPALDGGQHLLIRVLAMLRDYGMHEPECPARQVGKAQPCACWLAEHVDGVDRG